MRGRIIRRKIKGEKIKGSYTIVLELGRDDKTGKYRQKWIAVKGKHEAAVDRFTELMQQYKTTGVIETTKLTTSEFLRQWIESRHGKLDVSSWERYEQIIGRILSRTSAVYPWLNSPSQTLNGIMQKFRQQV